MSDENGSIFRRIVQTFTHEGPCEVSFPETKTDSAWWIMAGAGALAVGSLLLGVAALGLAQVIVGHED